MTNALGQTLGLYTHIPWCLTRCVYCDFNTYIDGEPGLKRAYHQALLREIQEAGAALDHPPLHTIFFGGGTPTTLAPGQLLELVEAVKASFKLCLDAEITTEANPGTLSLDYLRELRQGGVNRLSIGVQSFDNQELAFLSRLHDADTARQAVEQARQADFENLSLDLIFNLPRQTLEQWRFNLQEALKLEPDHLSIYALIIEPGTPLHRQVSQGYIPSPDDEVGADMYAATLDILGEAGYLHYEISNWAKAGDNLAAWQTPHLASAHNLIYWRNQPYLGMGAGAYGTINGERWANVKRPQSYIDCVQARRGLGIARDEKTFEVIDDHTAMTEHLMLGLRLVREGVSAAAFEARFGRALAERYAEAIDFGLEHGLLEWLATPTDSRLRLTQKGCFLANQVVLRFIE
jgi:oxygen-independent coproporphyrinogen-3 oxidase